MIKKLTISVILLALVTEFGIRAAGMVDFPLYDADNKIGYIPKASQSGSFLNSHDWQFNALHMGAGEFLPSDKLDTLLIGDSIVLGGNPLKQQERLGPQLQQVIGGNVWPISAGSWGMRNELIYLKQHPEVVAQVDQIIFVFNSGDFEQASSWACEFTHPRSKPAIATLYVLKKYVYNWAPCSDAPLPEFKVPDGDWHAELASFVQSNEMQGKKLTFFLYPDKNQAADKALQKSDYEQYAAELKEITHAAVYNVGRDSRWNTQMYRDGIHPSGEGNKVLSEIISKPELVDQL